MATRRSRPGSRRRPQRPSGIITLLTDFGSADTFVGVMKGVILSIHPAAQIVDLSHAVPAGDVQAAAFLLRSATAFFPAGSVHVAVVDPGVGSARRALALESNRQFYVGPDNGVFSLVMPEEPRAIELTNPAYFRRPVSATFHGRDIFAPVAAAIGRGVALHRLGPELENIQRFSLPAPRVTPGDIRGRVVHIDRFGNLVTNIPATTLQAWLGPRPASAIALQVGGKRLAGLSRTYAEVASGRPLALIGSHGFLEIAIRDGDARRRFPARRGTPVVVQTTRQ